MEINKIKKIEDYLGKNGKTKARIYYKNGSVEDARLTISIRDTIMKIAKGAQRYGYSLNLDEISDIELKIPDEVDIKTVYINNLLKRKKYILTHLHPNLWPHIRQDVLKITEDKIKKFLEDQTINSWYDACDKAKSYGLPAISRFKSVTLTTLKCPYIESIKKHLDKKESFYYYWRGSYDYSVEGDNGVNSEYFKDGLFRAWLNMEFKNKGNGHYYLLLDSNHALFIERD